jgi:hypothetical protein
MRKHKNVKQIRATNYQRRRTKAHLHYKLGPSTNVEGARPTQELTT